MEELNELEEGIEPIESNVGPDVPHETHQVRVVKMSHSVEDPLVKNTQFSFGGWIYQCYDERSRRRKFIQRIGKIEIITPPDPKGEEVPDV